MQYACYYFQKVEAKPQCLVIYGFIYHLNFGTNKGKELL